MLIPGLQRVHDVFCRKSYLSAAAVDFQGCGNVAEAAKAVGAHVVLISSCLVTKKHRCT